MLMEGNNTERFTMLGNCASVQHLAISLEANRMKYREVNAMGQKTCYNQIYVNMSYKRTSSWMT